VSDLCSAKHDNIRRQRHNQDRCPRVCAVVVRPKTPLTSRRTTRTPTVPMLRSTRSTSVAAMARAVRCEHLEPQLNVVSEAASCPTGVFRCIRDVRAPESLLGVLVTFQTSVLRARRALNRRLQLCFRI
jgi:hypothetical protein